MTNWYLLGTASSSMERLVNGSTMSAVAMVAGPSAISDISSCYLPYSRPARATMTWCTLELLSWNLLDRRQSLHGTQVHDLSKVIALVQQMIERAVELFGALRQRDHPLI